MNDCLLEVIKKFNLDMQVKIGSFQIKQNVLNLKSTLVKMATKKGGGAQKYQKIDNVVYEMTPKSFLQLRHDRIISK